MARFIFKTTKRALSSAAIEEAEPGGSCEVAAEASVTEAAAEAAPDVSRGSASRGAASQGSASEGSASPKRRGRPRKVRAEENDGQAVEVESTVAPVPVAPAPVAPVPVAPVPVAPVPVAPVPVAQVTELQMPLPQVALPQVALPQVALPQVALPPMDAPAVNGSQAAISYKIDFADRSQWYASTNGGKSKQPSGSVAVGGPIIDFSLSILPSNRDCDDYRLQVVFQEPARLAEINVNAVSYDARNDLMYPTSPARSLLGGLWAISQSDDDIHAFVEGGRFRLKSGTGKGMFIEVDAAHNGSWITMSSPAATNEIPKGVIGFLNMLEAIKHRFCETGVLLTRQAIFGEQAQSNQSQPLETVGIEVD